MSIPPQSADAAIVDQAVTGGWWYSQTGVPGETGFALVDDGSARFWSEFRRLGGIDALGYPVSHRFQLDGFIVQATQRVIMQWRPDSNSVMFINVFDRLHDLGHDRWLLATRQTPPPSAIDEAGKSWEQIVRGRIALMDQYPLIKSKYQAVIGDPIQVNGLPTSTVTDMGNHFALRSQRAVFQQWKEKVPWANPGDVTVALGGDISKEVGLVPTIATRANSLPVGPVISVPAHQLPVAMPPLPAAPSAASSPPVVSIDTSVVTSPLSGSIDRFALTIAEAGPGFRIVEETTLDVAALARSHRDPVAYAARLSSAGFGRGFRRIFMKESGTKATMISSQVDLFRNPELTRAYWQEDATRGWVFDDPSVRVELLPVAGLGDEAVALRFVSGESAGRGFLVLFRRANAIVTVFSMAQVAFPTIDETVVYASAIDRRLKS